MADKVNVEFSKGSYSINVTRRAGNRNPVVAGITSQPSILELAVGLANYDAECAAGRLVSKATNSSEDYRYAMNMWELNIRCNMSTNEEKLLLGIVTAHNRYKELVDELDSKQLKLLA